MTFHAWFTQRVAERGTQIAQARVIGYSRTTLRSWCTGELVPTATQLADIETVYGPVPPEVPVVPRIPAESYARGRQRRMDQRREAIKAIEGGETVTQVAARMKLARGHVFGWWRAHLISNGIGFGSKDGWTKAQLRCLLAWRKNGRDWSYIAQCLGRKAEDCEAKYEAVFAQTMEVKSD